jgi:hypothetical protein
LLIYSQASIRDLTAEEKRNKGSGGCGVARSGYSAAGHQNVIKMMLQGTDASHERLRKERG